MVSLAGTRLEHQESCVSVGCNLAYHFQESRSTFPASPLPTTAPCLLPYTQQKL